MKRVAVLGNVLRCETYCSIGECVVAVSMLLCGACCDVKRVVLGNVMVYVAVGTCCNEAYFVMMCCNGEHVAMRCLWLWVMCCHGNPLSLRAGYIQLHAVVRCTFKCGAHLNQVHGFVRYITSVTSLHLVTL